MDNFGQPALAWPGRLAAPVCNPWTKCRILDNRPRKPGDLRRLFDHSTVRTDALDKGLIGWLPRSDGPGVSGFVTACDRDERHNA